MSDKSIFSELYSDVLSYIGKKMKDSDRIKFEKELEADAFTKDAVEGLSTLKVDDIKHDIHSFTFIHQKKIQYKKAAIALFIIAIFALLIFVLLRKDDKDNDDDIKNEVTETLSSLEAKQKNVADSLEYDSTVVDLVDSVEMIIDDTNDTITRQPVISDTTSKVAPEIDNNEEQVNPEQKVKNKEESVSDLVDKIDDQSFQEAEKEIEEFPESKEKENTDEGDSDENEQPTNEITNVPEKLINNELNESDINPIQEDKNVIIEKPEVDNEIKQEIVNENNSTDESYRSQMEPRPGVNAEHKPLGGQALFDEYIENNLRYPLTGKGREVVKIEFTVNLTGELTDFKVLRSPENKAFEREAIRVISGGPKWSPAIEDGIPVKDSESLRIVFRP